MLDTTVQAYELWDSLWTADCAYEPLVDDGDNTYDWGMSVIYQLEGYPDSTEVETFLLPSIVGPPLLGVLAQVARVNRFRSITFIFTPATPNPDFYYYYNQPGRRMRLGYYVNEKGAIDSTLVNIPVAILTPYPNPAVVAEMGGENLRFSFQVPTDSTSFPIYDDPYIVVDLFNVAGEYVATIDQIATQDARMGTYQLEWDMRNEAGTDVASGVYLCYARLYSDSRNAVLLAEDKVKVAIIR